MPAIDSKTLRALTRLMSDPKLRALFEQAMQQPGQTGWSLARMVSSKLQTGPEEVLTLLKELNQIGALQSLGEGLNAYCMATPLAFELKSHLSAQQ